jgi:hypothetical protein
MSVLTCQNYYTTNETSKEIKELIKKNENLVFNEKIREEGRQRVSLENKRLKEYCMDLCTKTKEDNMKHIDLWKENKYLKIDIVSLKEFKEKAENECEASAICDTFMEQIEQLKNEKEKVKNENDNLEKRYKTNEKHICDLEKIVVNLLCEVTGRKCFEEEVDSISSRFQYLDQDQRLDALNILEEGAGIYYCEEEWEFADDVCGMADEDNCIEYREDEEDESEDIDVGDYCEWYCSNHSIRRHWVEEGGFYHTKY